jgi:hypothetical protein
MTDLTTDSTIFRAKREATREKPVDQPVAKQGAGTSVTNVEPPFTVWEQDRGRPYLADYFGLNEYWNDRDGGFGREIKTIEEYLISQIKVGRIDDSATAVREALRGIEGEAGANKTERTVNRIAKIAAYAEFLFKTRNL